MTKYTHVPFEALPLQERIAWIEARTSDDCYCDKFAIKRCQHCQAAGAMKEISETVNRLARDLVQTDVDRGDTIRFVFPLATGDK